MVIDHAMYETLQLMLCKYCKVARTLTHRISQHRVRSSHHLELVLRAGLPVLVWMVEEGQSAEGGLDVPLGGGAAHSQHRVVVGLAALAIVAVVVVIAMMISFALIVGLEEAVVLAVAAAAGVGLVCVRATLRTSCRRAASVALLACSSSIVRIPTGPSSVVEAPSGVGPLSVATSLLQCSSATSSSSSITR